MVVLAITVLVGCLVGLFLHKNARLLARDAPPQAVGEAAAVLVPVTAEPARVAAPVRAAHVEKRPAHVSEKPRRVSRASVARHPIDPQPESLLAAATPIEAVPEPEVLPAKMTSHRRVGRWRGD